MGVVEGRFGGSAGNDSTAGKIGFAADACEDAENKTKGISVRSGTSSLIGSMHNGLAKLVERFQASMSDAYVDLGTKACGLAAKIAITLQRILHIAAQ
jgi:hypothetical protein